MTVVTEISRAFALCATHETAIGLRDEIGFYQVLRSALRKLNHSERDEADLDHAIKQLVSSAVTTHGDVVDVFAAAGLQKPDISILSDEFLREVQGMKHKNLAAEVLATLLAGEIKAGFARNVVKSRQFSDMLKKTLNAYHNRAVTSQEVIEELMRLTRTIRETKERGERLGLNPQEEAFYDALADNESAVKAMGDPALRIVAQELVTAMRKNTSVDWTIRESVRAKIRVVVKKILRHHGFPPDLQDAAVRLVLEQAETLCKDWTGD